MKNTSVQPRTGCGWFRNKATPPEGGDRMRRSSNQGKGCLPRAWARPARVLKLRAAPMDSSRLLDICCESRATLVTETAWSTYCTTQSRMQKRAFRLMANERKESLSPENSLNCREPGRMAIEWSLKLGCRFASNQWMRKTCRLSHSSEGL